MIHMAEVKKRVDLDTDRVLYGMGLQLLRLEGRSQKNVPTPVAPSAEAQEAF